MAKNKPNITLKNRIDELVINRNRFEPDWYRCYYAYENNPFVTWSRSAQTILRLPYKKRFFVNLPEVKKQCDSFENLLLQFMPMGVVYPTGEGLADEKARDEASDQSQFLKQLYIDWDSKNLIHKYVHNAIKYPISFWEFNVVNRYDPETGKTKKIIKPSIGDAFDWLFDPTLEWEDNPLVARILRQSSTLLDLYKDFKMPDDSGTAGIDMKEMIFSEKYGNRKYGTEDNGIVMGFQAFEKTVDGIKETILDNSGNILRSNDYKGITFYPAVPLSFSSDDAYSPSFCQNLIPINRSISLVANRIEEFVMKFSKGQFMVKENSDVSFSDENAVFVKYEGEQPTPLPMPQLPPATIEWLNMLFTISERYGINQAAMGLSQRGSQNRSAKQAEQNIKTQQAQQKTALDNLAQSFKRIFEITVFYYSEYLDEPTPITLREDGEQFDTKKFIGEKYSAKDKNAIVIPKSLKGLEIEIQDVSLDGLDAKRAKFLEMATEYTKIPQTFQKTLLDLYKVGNTADIMKDLEKDQTLLDNPEFQNLIAQARAGNMDPKTKQAIADLCAWLAKQAPTPKPEDMGVKSKGGQPSPMPGQPQSPEAVKNPVGRPPQDGGQNVPAPVVKGEQNAGQ